MGFTKFLIVIVFAVWPPALFAQTSCESLVSPKLAQFFESSTEINKKAMTLELRRVCGENLTPACAETTLAGLQKAFDRKNFYSVNSMYVNEEAGIAIKGHKYKTRYLRTEAEKAPYRAEVKDGKVVSRATGEPFDPWDPHVGPRSENHAQLLKQEKIGSEEAIFVITKNKELLVNPEAKTGSFHHSSFEAGQPVLAPGRLNLTHDGRLQGIDTYSGHYQAGPEMLDVAIDYFRSQGMNLKESRRFYDNHLKIWRVTFQ